VRSAKTTVARSGLIQIDYALRYYLHIDPDGLTDDEWAIAIEALKMLRVKKE
jgi:hypothetical protein